MRLSKYLANSGIASRRYAEELIKSGRVKINGTVINLPQQIVTADDRVTFDEKEVTLPNRHYYLLLNKPANYITTAKDTHGRPTVMDLIKDVPERLYPVGRLDADTTGLLLITNDGELANRLTHPRYGIKKTYHVLVKGIPDEKDLQKLALGVSIDGKKTSPALVTLLDIRKAENKSLIEIIISEGRKRQVKKMMLVIKCPVVELRRVSFAGLKLDSLPEGSYRHLKRKEIDEIMQLVKLK